MKLQRSLWAHGLVLVVASGLAWTTWTREETPVHLTRERVQVWPGRIEQLESVRFETSKQTVEIVANKDDAGRWYVVRVDREVPGKTPPPPQDAPQDAGEAGEGGEAAKPAAPPAPAPEREKKSFVGVTEADKLAESLAPLLALRAVGRIEGDRDKEFGFDEPLGTLHVRLGGKEQVLVFGGVTPGGADRYARVKETGEVFAVPGDLVRRLEHAETRLLERDLNDFGEQKPDRVAISAGDRSRELVSVEGKLDGWADAKTPGEQDETVSNWMGKLGRLRVVSYIEDAKVLEGQQPVLVVKYERGRKPVGTLELFKLPKTSGDQPAESAEGEAPQSFRYVARTAHTRWPVEVGPVAGELERDLSSLFD